MQVRFGNVYSATQNFVHSGLYSVLAQREPDAQKAQYYQGVSAGLALAGLSDPDSMWVLNGDPGYFSKLPVNVYVPLKGRVTMSLNDVLRHPARILGKLPTGAVRRARNQFFDTLGQLQATVVQGLPPEQIQMSRVTPDNMAAFRRKAKLMA